MKGMMPPHLIVEPPEPKYKRDKDDFFETPAECTVALLQAENGAIPIEIWEPCVGKGAIIKAMPAREWVCTDLVDRGVGTSRRDFLMERKKLADAIITNPPFKLLYEFIMHAIELDTSYIAILHPTLFLNTVGWQEIVDRRAPRTVYTLTWRPDLFGIGTPDQRCCLCWSVWDDQHFKAINRPTIYRTLSRPK